MGLHMVPLETHAPVHKIHRRGRETHANGDKKRTRAFNKEQTPFKNMQKQQKQSEKRAETHVDAHSQEAQRQGKRTAIVMRPRSLASPMGMARPTRTKRTRKRNGTDFPV